MSLTHEKYQHFNDLKDLFICSLISQNSEYISDIFKYQCIVKRTKATILVIKFWNFTMF